MLKLALYQPDIPQNFGTNLRTAACFGIDVEVIEPCGFVLDDRKLRRAGMDYIEHVTYTRHSSWNHFINWADISKHRIILLSSKANIPYTDFSYKNGDILLLGRESAGVPVEIMEFCGNNAVTIPMHKGLRSLNVAVSAAIVLSEAVRQLGVQPLS